MVPKGEEANSTGSENFNSNSGKKDHEDLSWKTGDVKITQQSQPFKIGEFQEDGNAVLKTVAGKNHSSGITSNLLENGETSLQSFTIKNHDASSMALTLEPEGLGKINIELKMNQDQIQGHIMVHEATGKDLIESQLPNLLSDMTREGLQIGQFTVSLKQQGREQNPHQGFSGSADSKNPAIGTEEIGAITPLSAGNNLIHIII
jgi:flagellar hook-length control protein FliK